MLNENKLVTFPSVAVCRVPGRGRGSIDIHHHVPGATPLDIGERQMFRWPAGKGNTLTEVSTGNEHNL